MTQIQSYIALKGNDDGNNITLATSGVNLMRVRKSDGQLQIKGVIETDST